MATLHIKPGVQPAGLLTIICALGNVAQAIADPSEIWITAGIDGTHSPNSLHYALRAVDVRVKNFPTPAAIQDYVTRLKVALGPEYQILWESPNTPNQHLHIAYRPA